MPRRLKKCKSCHKEFLAGPKIDTCPQCQDEIRRLRDGLRECTSEEEAKDFLSKL